MRYDWVVTIGGVNVSQWVKAGGTIDYGNRGGGTAFQAPVAQFELFTEDENPDPEPTTWPVVNLGDPVIIHVTHDGTVVHRRFTGKVQALDYALYGLRVTAAGESVDWGARLAGGTGPYGLIGPESDTTRVARWCGDAFVTVTIEGSAGRWLRQVPPNSTDQPLLDLLLRIADDCNGLVMEDRLGAVHYRSRNFTTPPVYTLPPPVVESDTLDMALDRGTVLDVAYVYYGEPDPDTGWQKTGFYESPTPVGDFWRKTEQYSDLQWRSGAEGKAKQLVQASQPRWECPDVTLVMSQATSAQADAILSIQEGWPVRLDPLPAGCPISRYDGRVLGMTEVMHETDYRMVLHLAPAYATDVEPDETPIYPDGILTGYDTTGTVTADGRTYRWVQFGPGTHTLTNTHSGPVLADIVACAGGGGGGAWLYPGGPGNRSGGGGAGGTIVTTYTVPMGTLPLEVGLGGAGGTPAGPFYGENGHPTKVGTLTLPGGGGGGGSANAYDAGQWTPGNGMDGGSGGGASSSGVKAGKGTTGVGNDGALGDGGGGGGALTAGGNRTPGAGIVTTITGTNIEVGRGGDNNFTPGAHPGQGGGGGYAGIDQNPGAPGAPGVIILRYRVA